MMRAWVRSRPKRGYVLAIVLLGCFGAGIAHAQGNATTIVSYIDVSSAKVDAAKAMLTAYGARCAREVGNRGVRILQEIGRPDRLAVVEVWNDKQAADRHMSADTTLEFREALKSLQVAPPDDRVGMDLMSGDVPPESPAEGSYVLTHVDIAPERSADSLQMLKQAATASRRDEGNLAYEIIQQANRPNHFTFIEVWADMKSLQAHAVASHTVEFRDKLQPVEGALYDERLYRELR
jgi:quinol monooxygenase YgiN